MRSILTGIKKICALLIITAIIVSTASPVMAWSQPVHRAINNEAVNLFKTVFAPTGKFKKAPINFNECYTGVGITDRFYFANTYKATSRLMQMPAWIVEGGDWADEPEIYASVRHFYDPLSLSGVYYLTDHSVGFGTLYDQPQIDAITWALSHNDNPFNWTNGLKYYKMAMEIPEDGERPESFKGTHFKLNVSLNPKDRKEEREVYLALAYRALGETMHLLADMVQPAHVRNDSHPKSEPLEDTMTPALVREFASNFKTGSAVDARMTENFTSTGGSRLHIPENLFFTLASFTNKNFYSSDTIYDKDSGVMPENGETPIPGPQFKDLIPGKTELLPQSNNPASGKTKPKGETISYLGAPFLNDIIPMIQEKVSGRIFKSKTYFVPANENFTKGQGRVLIPIAIAACSDLMQQFFPTLELQTKFEDPELIIEEINGKPKARYEINPTGTMTHNAQQDQAWQEAGFSISYTGSGSLLFENEGKIRKSIPLSFKDGQLTGFQKFDKEWVEEPLKLHLQQNNDIKLTKEEEYTRIKDKDIIYIQINAGSRTWNGSKLHYQFPVETLEADYTEHGLREEENHPGFGVREFAAFAEAMNFDFEDNEKDIYLDPLYTGKADLVFEDEKGSVKKTIAVWFEDGALSKILDAEGNLVNKPLLLYGDETAEYELTDMEKMYEIKRDQSVYFRIRIDHNRYLESGRWSYNQADEEIDGLYNGSLTISATQKLREFIVTMFSYMVYPIANAILSAMGEITKSFDEIRSAVDGAISSETASAEITLNIVTESGNRVAIDFIVYDELGNPTSTSCSGTYKNGQLIFESPYQDGSVLKMSGWLRGDTLSGTIEGSAWGAVTQAIEGNWTAVKAK